ncbi:MAG: Crp/Fnr family transcriptional regulator [Bacteroidales bacterium]|jgi:CRP-like cAMP-binding protein|nr:Crp/Fnr family transcriptional regulator [Bacteroidales bacterium]
MNNSFLELLKSLAPFSDVEQNNAMPFFKEITLQKNDFFVKAGHFSDRMAFVQSGLLRSYFITKEKEITTFFAIPGSVCLDAHSFFGLKQSQESIQALMKSELLVINREDLYSLYEENWKWQQVGRLLVEKYFVASEERTIALQSQTAHELYEQFVAEFPDVVQMVPQHYIASYLGITPETLSRVRHIK